MVGSAVESTVWFSEASSIASISAMKIGIRRGRGWSASCARSALSASCAAEEPRTAVSWPVIGEELGRPRLAESTAVSAPVGWRSSEGRSVESPQGGVVVMRGPF